MNTPTTNHEPNLLVDIETGVVLEAPPQAVVTTRYVNSHPFIELFPGTEHNFVVAGPHAQRVASGAGGDEYVIYAVEREVAGSLHLVRES